MAPAVEEVGALRVEHAGATVVRGGVRQGLRWAACTAPPQHVVKRAACESCKGNLLERQKGNKRDIFWNGRKTILTG